MPYKDRAKRLSYSKKWNKAYYSSHKVEEISRKENRKKMIGLWLADYKSGLSCQYCGEETPECLDFHHLDEAAKDRSLGSVKNWGWSIDRIKKEIEKCIVLCANCHRKLHFGLIGVK